MRNGSLAATHKGRIISQQQNDDATYIEQFEAELAKKLQASESAVTLIKWACEKVLESYKNGLVAGKKRSQQKR